MRITLNPLHALAHNILTCACPVTYVCVYACAFALGVCAYTYALTCARVRKCNVIRAEGYMGLYYAIAVAKIVATAAVVYFVVKFLSTHVIIYTPR